MVNLPHAGQIGKCGVPDLAPIGEGMARTGDMTPIAGPELARLAPIGSESPSGPPRRLIAAHEASCYQRPASVLSSTVLPESAPPAAPQPRQVYLSPYQI